MKLNRIIYIFLFLATYIFATNYGGTISYLVLYLVLFIPILSIVYLLYVFLRFRIYQYIDKRVMVKGDHIVYKFHLANEDLIAYTDVRVTFEKKTSSVEEISPDTSYLLLPHEEVKKQTTLCCHYRGQYFVGIDHVIVRDFFHLFKMKYSNKNKIEVTVMPRVIHLEKLELGLNEENLKVDLRGATKKQLVRDNEVRKYQSGDPMKLIHWKASARTGTLLTQKHIDEPKTEIISVLDLSQKEIGDYEKIVIEDKLLEAVLAIHYYFNTHAIPSRVLYGDKNIRLKTIQTRQDFDEFYNTCKYLRFQSQYSCPELVEYAIKAAKDIGYLILLTATLDDKLCIACNQAVQYGLELTILFVGDDNLISQKPLLNERIHLHIINMDTEVEDVLSNRREQS